MLIEVGTVKGYATINPLERTEVIAGTQHPVGITKGDDPLWFVTHPFHRNGEFLFFACFDFHWKTPFTRPFIRVAIHSKRTKSALKITNPGTFV